MSTSIAGQSVARSVDSYHSKAVYMALFHTIISMVVFAIIAKQLTKYNFPFSTINQQTLYPWIAVLVVLLTALFGLFIYSNSQKIALLKSLDGMVWEIILTIFFQLLFVIILTFVYFSTSANVSQNSMTFFLFLGINPLLIFNDPMSQMFLSANILLVVTPMLTSFLTCYFIIFGVYLIRNSKNGTSQTSLSKLLWLLGMFVVTNISLLIFHSLVELQYGANSPDPRYFNLYGYIYDTSTSLFQLIGLAMLLWWIYPAILGKENCTKLLVNRKSQLILVLVGILGSSLLIPPIVYATSSSASFSQIAMYYLSNVLLMIYNGFLFAFQILVGLSLKYDLPQVESKDLKPISTHPTPKVTSS